MSTSSRSAAAAAPKPSSPAPASSTPPRPGNSPSASAAASVPAPAAPGSPPEAGSASGSGGAAPAAPTSTTTRTTTYPTTQPDEETQPRNAEPESDAAAVDGAIPTSNSPPPPPKSLPALPSPGDVEKTESGTRTIQVNGQPLALDALGPMVVNRDGTLSRVANWGEMTPHERAATLRVLGKRNQLRLGDLRSGQEPSSS